VTRLLVAQSGGCTAVINGSLIGVVDEALAQEGIDAVYGARFGIRGVLDEDFVDLGRQSRATLDRVRRTPSAALGSARYKLSDEECATVLDILARHHIGLFLLIGGNDSADTAHRLGRLAAQRGCDLRVVAIPKTIDNDLPETDHCPGYGSAARFLAQCTVDGGRDAEAIRHWDPIKVVEVMGRNAGWLAAATALGSRDERDAPHLIYVPERPFNLASFLEDVRAVHARLGYCVAVVAETVRDAQGRPVGGLDATAAVDAFGHPVIAGTAAALCSAIGAELGLKARFDKPGTMQRMSMALASETDLQEAYEVGRAGVRAVVAGESGVMITLQRVADEPYRCTTGFTPVERVANTQRLLPPEYLHPTRPWVTDAFLAYARPLLGGPLLEYGRLEDIPMS
jgi:6-phosphofructokinase 1